MFCFSATAPSSKYCYCCSSEASCK